LLVCVVGLEFFVGLRVWFGCRLFGWLGLRLFAGLFFGLRFDEFFVRYRFF